MALPEKMKLSIEQALLDSRISVHPPVAEKRPVRSILVYVIPVDFSHDDFFAIDRTFRDDLAIRAANKTLSPEFDSVSARRRLMANAIRSRDIAAICDCVAPLNCFPGRILRCAELFLFGWVPADRRWIKNNFRAAQRGQSR